MGPMVHAKTCIFTTLHQHYAVGFSLTPCIQSIVQALHTAGSSNSVAHCQ